MSRPVFISHAVANKELADKLVDLLETGVGIPDRDIFCSSLEGMGIPSGHNFVDFIRAQIREPRVVILLLSPQYFESQFCLCELGAAWVLTHQLIPLLVPPLEFSDVKAVLTGVQVLKINDGAALNQMQQDLIDGLSIRGKAFARWESKRKKFLKSIEGIEKSTPLGSTVSREEYEELRQKYEGAVSEIEDMEEDIEERGVLIDKLKSAKDSEDVKAIVAESLSERERFDELVKRAKDALKPLPSIVEEALYYHFRDECLPWPNAFDDYQRDEVNEAIEDDYLAGRDEGVEVVEDDPRIARAISELWELRSFVNSIDEDSGFNNYYSDTYDHRLNFESRRFWRTHLF